VQRRALGALFLGLAVALLLTSIAALTGSGGGIGRLIVAFASLALAGWLASLAVSAFRA
jgi:hypothetical protein